MENNTIQNPKTPTSKGICLNDKDYMNSLLSTIKDMVKNYAVALTEASNETLYKKYKKIFDKLISLQRETYELMFQNGWYALEKADKEKIQTKNKLLCQELKDLNK